MTGLYARSKHLQKRRTEADGHDEATDVQSVSQSEPHESNSPTCSLFGQSMANEGPLAHLLSSVNLEFCDRERFTYEPDRLTSGLFDLDLSLVT